MSPQEAVKREWGVSPRSGEGDTHGVRWDMLQEMRDLAIKMEVKMGCLPETLETGFDPKGRGNCGVVVAQHG